MCQAATQFQQAAKGAQERKMRFLSARIWAVRKDNPVLKPFRYSGLILKKATTFTGLRSFEELGLPIMHPGLCKGNDCAARGGYYEKVSIDDYFPDCPDKAVNEKCATNTLYPVDMWIIDPYWTPAMIANDTQYEALVRDFPDPALLAKQYIMDTGHMHIVYSYRSVGTFLRNMANRINSAKRLHPATSCTDSHVSTGAHVTLEAKPLEGGEFACFD